MPASIFKANVSHVVKGIEGKCIMIYGTNRTGKTSNAVKGVKPLVVSFENGLAGLEGVPNVVIQKWTDWTNVVKELTSENTIKEAKELYQTIIVDTAEGIGDLGSEYICNLYGVTRIAEGNRGYGLWQEYSLEMTKWLRLLVIAGYTVVFLAHEGERSFKNPNGGDDLTKIYPRGNKRIIDPICDNCNVIGYARMVAGSPFSTLFIRGTEAYHAGSHFDNIVDSIPEWNLDKLSKAIDDAINTEAKNKGTNPISFEQAAKDAAAKVADEEKNIMPFDTLRENIGMMLKHMKETEGSLESYDAIRADELGTTEFKVNSATEKQREQVEIVYNSLVAKGYGKEFNFEPLK